MTDTAGFPDLVRELMTVGVFTCTADSLIIDLVPYFLDKNLEEAVVMEDGCAIGVIGQDELVRAIENPEWRSLKVADLMREDYLRIPADSSLKNAVKIMQEKNNNLSIPAAIVIAGVVIAGGIYFVHISRSLSCFLSMTLSA